MKIQTARKDHVCSSCGRKIEKGSTYWRDYVEGVRDDKQHSNCAQHEQHITAQPKEL